MSPRELAWRARAFVRDRADRPRITFGIVPDAVYGESGAADILDTGLRLCEQAPGCWIGGVDAAAASWRERLLRQADELLQHRFTFFSLDQCDLGDPIDWNRDHEIGTPTPRRFSSAIDYRDPRVTGDAKVVWEPARHHQLVVLGRAYRATGEERYAREAVAQIESWLLQCPFGMGMHWRSPLELAIRAINWIWTIDLIRPSGILTGATAAKIVNALHLHLWDIRRKYSRGSSANNHRIGEAAALFIAATCLPGLRGSTGWRAESRGILESEIVAQTYADGASREQAFGYHVFVLQFFMLAAVAAERAGEEFSSTYKARLTRMFEFTAAMLEGGPAPTFGDSDDGYVIDLGDGRDARGWLAAGAAFLDRPDLAVDPAAHGETARWILEPSLAHPAPPDGPGHASRPLTPRAFAESGLYLLQSGTRGGHDSVSVLFDCGDLGYGSIAAHGHADALAFTLRVGGEDILVDPGTYDYFRFPEWRDYFRSTRAHNTISIDGVDQSMMLGAFMWGRRAHAWCEKWEPRAEGGRIAAAHDGYAGRRDPVRHTRQLDLDARAGVLTITDHLAMAGEHLVTAYFHFSERCAVSGSGASFEARTLVNAVELQPDPRLTSTLLRGSTAPIGGWVSRAYHSKSPATTVVASGTFRGDTQLVSRLSIAAARRSAAPGVPR